MTDIESARLNLVAALITGKVPPKPSLSDLPIRLKAQREQG